MDLAYSSTFWDLGFCMISLATSDALTVSLLMMAASFARLEWQSAGILSSWVGVGGELCCFQLLGSLVVAKSQHPGLHRALKDLEVSVETSSTKQHLENESWCVQNQTCEDWKFKIRECKLVLKNKSKSHTNWYCNGPGISEHVSCILSNWLYHILKRYKLFSCCILELAMA